MSTDTKYQVMGELLGIMPSDIEKAEEQASRIIEMVKGEGSFAPTVKDVYWPNMAGPASDQLLEEPASVKVQPTEFTTEDLSHLKDRGHTWAEIAAEAGISQDAARKRVTKWRAKQPKATKTMIGVLHEKDDGKYELIEPGAEEARQEAEDAEATIRKSLTVEEQIGQFIQCMILKDPNVMDLEIMHAVHRNFAGVSISVKDIAAQRRGIA